MKTVKLLFFLIIFIFSSLYAEDIIIDDYEKKGNLNHAGGRRGIFGYNPAVAEIVSGSSAYSGRGNSLKVTWQQKQGWTGNWNTMNPPLDVSRAKYFVFYIKGEKGGEGFQIGFKDASYAVEGDASIVGNVRNYITVTTNWQKAVIPLSDVFGINFKQLANVLFIFPPGEKQTVYYDNLTFTDYLSPKERKEIAKREKLEKMKAAQKEDGKKIEPELKIADFDKGKLLIDGAIDILSKKAEVKGSIVAAGADVSGSGQAYKFDYDIAAKGQAYLAITFSKRDVSKLGHLVFWTKGEQGGEILEIGLKDKQGDVKWHYLSRHSSGIGREWRQQQIDLDEFLINQQQLTGIYLRAKNNTSGCVYFDEFGFCSEGGMNWILKNRTVIDNFETTKPNEKYKLDYAGGGLVRLARTTLAKKGDYAMEVKYQIDVMSTEESMVDIIYPFRTPLSLNKARTIKFWLRGNGLDNSLLVIFTDADGEKWYVEDYRIMRNSKWVKFEKAIADFRLLHTGKVKNKKFDKSAVSAMTIRILSSVRGLSKGKFQIDQIEIKGARQYKDRKSDEYALPSDHPTYSEVEEMIDHSVKADFIPKLSFDTTYTVNNSANLTNSDFFFKNGNLLQTWFTLFIDASLGVFNLQSELVSSFRGSGAQLGSFSQPMFGTYKTFDDLHRPQFDIFAQDITGILFLDEYVPFIDQVVLGSLNINWSPFTVYNQDAFYGARLQGRIEKLKLDYDSFYFKHWHDSFTLGGRCLFNYKGLGIDAVYVHHRMTGLDSVDQSGFNTKKILSDQVYTVELKLLLKGKFYLNGLYGEHFFKRDG
ncbi:MAG TPA: hypothetical protein VKS21_01205, partial [Spirochaetota bacterium]|nr:hypothetical protein [Spirochaetota bacterium]